MLAAARSAARALARLLPRRVREGPGAGLRLDLRRASADYAAGRNELPVQRAVLDALDAAPPPRVFLDVGANIGYFALLAARRVASAGEAWCLEPEPRNARACAHNARLNRLHNVRVLALAAGDADARVPLVLARHPGGSSVQGQGEVPDPAGRTVVRLARIDTLVASGELPAPRVVKVDVEGAELAVLRGMEGTLASARPVVICEADGASRDVAETRAAEIERFLRDRAYATRRLPDSYAGAGWSIVHVVGEPLDQPNALR